MKQSHRRGPRRLSLRVRSPDSILVLAWILVSAPTGLAAAPEFVEAGAAWGVPRALQGIMAHAAAAGDVDGDGDLDLYVGTFCDRPPEQYVGAAGPVPNRLLINQGESFVPSDQEAVVFRARTSGAVFADLDNDGDLDLYVSNNSKRTGLRVANRLYENRGGRLYDVSAGNAACPIMGGRSVGVLDIDGDRRLDLVVAEDSWTEGHTRLFRNAGGLTFTDHTTAAGLPEDLPGLGVVTCDLNGDTWPDIFISQANRLFLARGDGTYREGGSEAFAYPPINREASPCGVASGDLDRDGDIDLVIVDHSQPGRQHLFLNRGVVDRGIRDGVPVFEDVTREAGLEYRFPSWTPEKKHLKHAHVEIADFDNDGWPDILVSATAAGRPFVCRNLGVVKGLVRFETPPPEAGDAYYAAGPVADYDRDGRQDIFCASWLPEQPSRLFLNRSRPAHWLAVRVEGSGRVNRMGIGCVVKLYRAGRLGDREALLGCREIGTGFGFCSGQEAVAHFGLGGEERCDAEVVFPYGRGTKRLTGVTCDRVLVIEDR